MARLPAGVGDRDRLPAVALLVGGAGRRSSASSASTWSPAVGGERLRAGVVELLGPRRLEEDGVGEHEAGELVDRALGQQLGDVLAGVLGHPVVDLAPGAARGRRRSRPSTCSRRSDALQLVEERVCHSTPDWPHRALALVSSISPISPPTSSPARSAAARTVGGAVERPAADASRCRPVAEEGVELVGRRPLGAGAGHAERRWRPTAASRRRCRRRPPSAIGP